MRTATIAGLIALVPTVLAAQTPESTTLIQWTFDKPGDAQGWQANSQIHDFAPQADGLHFATHGGDPQLYSPLFDPIPVDNQCHIEIDIACDQGGVAEFYYTNKTTGRYNGLEPNWRAIVTLPASKAPDAVQTVAFYPFWSHVKQIIHLRFDPPPGNQCRLVAIRIVQAARTALGADQHTLGGADLASWTPLGSIDVQRTGDNVTMATPVDQGLLLTAVEPFDAATRPILRLDTLDGPASFAVYWATTESTGLSGAPVFGEVTSSDTPRRGSATIDLRANDQWTGQITHIGVGPLSAAPMTITRFSLESAGDGPALIVRSMLPVNAPCRVARPATIRCVIENVGNIASPAAHIALHIAPAPTQTADDALAAEAASPYPHRALERPTGKPSRIQPLPAIEPGQRIDVDCPVTFKDGGYQRLFVTLNATATSRDAPCFVATLPVGPTVGKSKAEYVPPPRPLETDYEIGVYYFPGWAEGANGRWKLQADYPERDSLLGWYREGDPEVADWHIKWAIENGITFFIYDWYWRDGKIALQEGLDDGFLHARYADKFKFCVMWANHPPFANHTREQLLEVTDYWIEHYLRRPNYYRIDGRCYVSFFTPDQLRVGLKTDEAVRDALDAMRQRVRDAGLAGLYLVACGDASPASQTWYKKVGFDAVTAYNYPAAGASTKHSPYAMFIAAHQAIWQRAHDVGILRYIPVLTTGWDSRPWHHENAVVRFGRTTPALQHGMAMMKAFLDKTNARIGILEAWNEWGEGSYIEPNCQFGFADLEAIRQTFAPNKSYPINIAPSDVGLGPYDVRPDRAERPTNP